MRTFSPYMFIRLRQNTLTAACAHRSKVVGLNEMEYFCSSFQRNWPRGLVKRSAKVSWVLIVTAFVLMSWVPHGYALEKSDELSLDQLVLSIDQESKKLGGIKKIFDHLKESFQVKDDLIYVVRDQEVKYGDIFTVFALAERMPGGINEDNVTEVIDLHNGRLSRRTWQEVALKVGVDHESAVQRVKDSILRFWVNLE